MKPSRPTGERRSGRRSHDLRPTPMGYALVAIVFSAITLEGFINELVAMARLPAEDNPPAIKNFTELAIEFDRLRASTESKFHVARIVFTGQAWDRGAPPYQDFQLLIDLRDALVHHKPELWAGRFQSRKILDKLRSKNMTAVTEFENPLWMDVSTRAAARWACNTATSMIKATLNIIPESYVKRTLLLGLTLFGNSLLKIVVISC